MRIGNKTKTGEIPLRSLSRYRAWLMALAIVLVMRCHCTVYVNLAWRQFCQIGVDIFFLASGIGVYSSLSRDGRPRAFYGKRLKKLLIPYGIVLAIWAVVQCFCDTTGGLEGFLRSYSLVTFYSRGVLSEWYLAAILPLYALSPLLFRLVNRGKKTVAGLCAGIWLVSVLLCQLPDGFLETEAGHALQVVNEIFVIRIPLYIVGLYVERLILSKEAAEVRRGTALAILLAGGALFWLNVQAFPGPKLGFSQWYVSRTLFGVICLPLMLLAADVFSRWEKKKCALCGVLTGLSAVTFELYLLHEKALAVTDKLLAHDRWTTLLSNAVAVALSVALAALVHKAAACLQRRMK